MNKKKNYCGCIKSFMRKVRDKRGIVQYVTIDDTVLHIRRIWINSTKEQCAHTKM